MNSLFDPQAMLDPATVGLLQTGLGMLSAGGPSRMPVSFGQALGQAGQQGLGAYQTAQKMAMDEAFRRRLAEMEQVKTDMLKLQMAEAQKASALKERLLTPLLNGAGMGGMGGAVSPQITALMLSGDSGLTSYAKMLMEANKGIAQRPGAPVVNPYTGQVIAQPTPSVPPGVALQIGSGGPQAYQVPGAQGAMAGLAASQAGATEAGKAPYQLETLQTPGAPSLMTREQAIEAATGRPMPQPMMQAPQPIRGMAGSEAEALRAIRENMAQGGRGGTMEISSRASRGLRLQDQGESAEQREYGKSLGEYSAKVQAEAANAAVANRYLDNMELAAQDIRLGKLAPAQSALTQWAQALNLPVPEDAKGAAGSIQALTSMAIKMAGTATRQSDAQPSQLQYFKILESMPNEARTADGFQKITAYLRDANNYNIAKMQKLQNWRQTHNGSAEGFEASWPEIATQLPFVWNQQRRIDDLKDITGSTGGGVPQGVRVTRVR